MSTIATPNGTTETAPMTYARARLWLGISCVGTQVLLAICAVAGGLPERILPRANASLATDLASMASFFLAVAVLMLPFDIIGGWVLPRRFGRSEQTLASFATKLVHGVVVQTGLLLAFFAGYRVLGEFAGVTTIVVAFIVVQIALIGLQLKLAKWVGGMQEHRLRVNSARAISLTADDLGFTGGVAGLPGADVIVLPTAWLSVLPDRLQKVALLRRQFGIDTGRRVCGMFMAVVWNTLSLIAALNLPGGGVESAASLVTAYFYFSLFGFVGLLVLPTFSRNAVLAIDGLAASESSPDEITQLATTVDELSEGEPSRSAGVESVFHPIPCVQRRATSLSEEKQVNGPAWHVARMALYCAWAFGGPLSRSVHCNVGRPELWVFLPAD